MKLRSLIVMLAAVALGLAAGLGAAGCGGSDEAATTTPGTAVTQPESITVETKPETRPAKKPSAPKVKTIRITVKGGRPQGGIQRPVLKKGARVVLVIAADAGEEVHLHGYDVEKPVTPGKPVRLRFTATVPGRFELELHHPNAVLADIEVRP